MSVQQPPGQQTVEGIEDSLTALLAGHLTGAKVHLYKVGFHPTVANVAADFVANECDFTGYASSVLTWTAVGLDAVGNPFALSNRAFFQATDAVAPNVVGGAWISHEAVGPPVVNTSLEFYQFNPAVNMNTALASMGVVVTMMLPGTAGYAIVDF